MAQGETFNSGDFKCTLLEDGSAEIKKYTGKASVLEIPASWTDTPSPPSPSRRLLIAIH